MTQVSLTTGMRPATVDEVGAGATRQVVIGLSAVTAGVTDVREVIAGSKRAAQQETSWRECALDAEDQVRTLRYRRLGR